MPGEELEGLFHHLWKSTDPGSWDGAIGIQISTSNHIQVVPIDYEVARRFIGGDVQVGPAPNGGVMLVDEDGLLKELPPNDVGSRVAGWPIVGNAIYVPKEHARKALRARKESHLAG